MYLFLLSIVMLFVVLFIIIYNCHPTSSDIPEVTIAPPKVIVGVRNDYMLHDDNTCTCRGYYRCKEFCEK